ncbi:TonB-dependent receptor plug domain-containing protein [Desertivirga xinjiangensis]|uniref:TonB-dependent receptor plug domain-containing protein n=1 Tax=Desertivirga xinjiangensis TaxID=539206 RepID=UPI00210AD9AA|nr:TonB-dependent receptor [Pedobacter xinjiangensis]
MTKKKITKRPGWLPSISVFTFLLFYFFVFQNTVFAQSDPSPEELKMLSIEELLNIQVTSVSKVPQKLTEVASAIQVITQSDILRSAATNIPEALRLVPNLQVSQVSARHWIISSRGFNSIYSNKLLVMIDGRNVYSPLFAGVFWDAQNVLLEDVDRIEVISGPGGTQWGGNAVNGVINIITKKTRETKGLFVSETVGSFVKGGLEARYGGKINDKIFYKVYAQHLSRNNTHRVDGTGNTDDWALNQGGLSLDVMLSEKDELNFSGNFYAGQEQDAKVSSIDGQNVMGTWTHTFSERSNLVVHGYADRTWRRDITSTINDQLSTFDVDLVHNLSAGKKHKLVWGLGYRFMADDVTNLTEIVGLVPENRNMFVVSSFIEDEINIIKDKLKFIVGTKLQRNNFSGNELQPTARVSFTPVQHHLVWAAVSRAVRTPSRNEVDYHLPIYPVPPSQPSVAGGPNFRSEKLVAFEFGYRTQFFEGLSLSLATFYNKYDDLYSVEPLPGTLTYQIQNGVKGTTYGYELAGNFIATSYWQLRGGYTYFHKKLENKPGNLSDLSALQNLGSDANNRAFLQSMLNLSKKLKVDISLRYVDYLPPSPFNARIPAYTDMDGKISFTPDNHFEFSFAGQNLLHKRKVEALGMVEIPRGIYGKLTFRY